MSWTGKYVFLTNNEKQMVTGEVIGEQDQQVTIMTVDNEEIVVLKTLVREMDSIEYDGVDDLINLNFLDEAALFHSLYKRFLNNKIYTYCGNILVSVNPFKIIDDLYTLETAKSYYNAEFGSKSPHIFAIANECYSSLGRDQKSQCVVISGESGAGKTEATKLILLFLTTVTSHTSDVQEQIISASPILEAFGNAKTVRNDNSSRFGKFLKVHFNTAGQIVGATTKQYLLEKSRLVSQTKEERNYHIFYQMLQGVSDEMKSKLQLTQPEDFFYLAHSTPVLPKVDDAENYREVTRAMEMLNFGNAKDQIIQVLAAILHLGNLQFDVDDKELTFIKNKQSLSLITQLIGLDMEEFNKIIITRTTVTRGEKFETPLTKLQAADSKDAIAKFLYDSLFSFIVEFINLTTSSKGLTNTYIGILDIFGFENFEKNSFEQFCINFANERLQFFFNQHIFKMEQEEYKKEGIPWSNIDFIDNTPCIELISRKPIGVLALLDEESNFPKGTDQSLLSKLHQQCVESKYYVKPKQSKPVFSIVHYAGEVQYTIESFIDKNKDTLRQEIMDLFSTSKVEIIQQLFANSEIPSNYDADKGITIKNATTRLRASKTDKKASGPQKKATLGTQFATSLGELMETLGACNPYFVRCVKPNQKKVCDRIDRKVVLDQLQYSGMLATVKVRKAGYPIRMLYTEFAKRYNMLVPTAAGGKAAPKPKELVEFAMKSISTDPQYNKALFYLGSTKLFMKQDIQNILERKRGEKFAIYAIRIQARWRGYKQRKEYLRDLFLVVRIQVKVRIFVKKIKFRRRMKAALTLQKYYKGHRQRLIFKKLLTAYKQEQQLAIEQEQQRLQLEEQQKLEELNKFANMLPPAFLENIPAPMELPVMDNLPPPPPMFFNTPSYKYDEVVASEGNESNDFPSIVPPPPSFTPNLPPPPTFIPAMPNTLPPPPTFIPSLDNNDMLHVHDRRESVATSMLDDDDDDQVTEVALPDDIQDILDDLNDIFDDAGATNNKRQSNINPNLKKFIPKASKDGQRINYQLPEQLRKKCHIPIRLLGFQDIVPVVRIETHITAYRKQLVPDDHALQKIAQVFFQDPEDIHYSKRKLNKSLLTMENEQNLIALRINKTILKMTHEQIDPVVYFHCCWYMAEEIKAHPILKDEIICQLWKQLNDCPNQEVLAKTWVLLTLFLQTYVPHPTIKQSLASFMLNSQDEMGRLCLESLTRPKSEDRKSAFSGMEWIAAAKAQMIALPTEASNQELCGIGVDGLSTAKEVLTAYGNYFGLNGEDLQGYAIELELDGHVIDIDSSEMIMDVIAQLEKEKNGITSLSPFYLTQKEIKEEEEEVMYSKSTMESISSSLAEIRQEESAM